MTVRPPPGDQHTPSGGGGNDKPTPNQGALTDTDGASHAMPSDAFGADGVRSGHTSAELIHPSAEACQGGPAALGPTTGGGAARARAEVRRQ